MMLKKSLAAVLAAMVMGMGLGAVPALAADENYDFNQQDQKLRIVQDGDSKSHYNVDQTSGKLFHYEEALYGKDAGDFCQVIQLKDIPKDDKANDGFAMYGERIYINEDTPARTIEFSIAAEGDYDHFGIVGRPYYATQGYSDNILRFQSDGKVTVQGTEKAQYQQKQWQRVAFSTYSDGSVDIWVNGTQVANKALYSKNTGFNGYGWLRIALSNPSKAEDASAPEKRNAKLCIDDYHEYAGAYQPAATGDVTYSLAPDSGLFAGGNHEIYLPKGKTAEELFAALTQDGKTPKLYRDASLTETFTSGPLSVGNVLLLTSQDGRQLRYLPLVSSELPLGRDFNQVDNGWYSVDNQGQQFTTGYAPGLYGRDSEDRSYVSNGAVPAGTEVVQNMHSIRFAMDTGVEVLNDTNWTTAKKPVVTVELSMATEGEFGTVTLQGRPRYFSKVDPSLNTGGNNRGIRAYLRVQPDGTVTLKDGKETAPFKLNPKEWFRVALTFYPEALTYDMYINGERVVEKDVISSGYTDTEKWEYRGMQWMSPAINFEVGTKEYARSARLAMDDFKVFVGEYDVADRVISVDGYDKDDNLGVMDIPGNLSVADFAGGLRCGTAVPTLYADHDFTEKITDGYLQDGNVLLLTSANGLVRKYYTLRISGMTCDERIRLYVNGSESDALTAGALKAEIAAGFSGETQAPGGVLALAIYRDGALERVVLDEKQISASTDFSVSCDLTGQDMEGVSVKAMFWRDMETMCPYVPARSYR